MVSIIMRINTMAYGINTHIPQLTITIIGVLFIIPLQPHIEALESGVILPERL
jgi:hypothetical protein